jgi:hypothetical protein
MSNTEYLNPQTIGQILVPYLGGFSKWYYTFIENISTFPDVDPETQYLATEPTLLPGKTWYGPVTVPKNMVGFVESSVFGKPGHSWKTKFMATQPGSNMNVDVNLDNLIHHQICVIGKLRSGGYWKVIGNKKKGLSLDVESDSGIGNKAFLNKLTMSFESRYKGPVLTIFSGDNSLPATLPPGLNVTIVKPDSMDVTMNEDFLVDDGDTVINWTPEYIARFGEFPDIEAWVEKDGGFDKANILIEALGNPPTSYIIHNGGAPGTIKIM